jgi:hypothetical protein
MKLNFLRIFLPCAWIAITNQLSAQTTAFTYQGRLTDGGMAPSANYDLRFTLFDSASSTNWIGGPLTNGNTPVSNGLFSVTLDFGSPAFSGGERWLEVAVRTVGGGPFLALAPRQHITSAPYSISAGTVAGGGSGLTNLNASALASGTVPASRLATGAPGSSNWLRGDQTWTSLTANDIAGLNTNSFVTTNDSRRLNFSNNLSQVTVSNLWMTNWISRSQNPAYGSLAFTNGVLYFDYPNTGNNYLFLNKFHGGGSDGSELQIPANLIYFGPVDGGHVQVGLGVQRRIVMFMQYAQADIGAPNYHKGQSHQFGFRYAYDIAPNYTGYAIPQWNINATNYDDVAGHAKLIVWSPKYLTTSGNDTELGTNMFYWDTHGWTSLQSEHKFYAEDSIAGTNYVVDCFRDVHSVTLQTNFNITLVNLILTNETQRIELFLFPGSSPRSLGFPSANWIWEGETGPIAAPTNIPASQMMHVTLFANGGALGTNIVASYKLGAYTAPSGLASINPPAGAHEKAADASDETNNTAPKSFRRDIESDVQFLKSTVAEREAEIARLEQRLSKLERLLAPNVLGQGGSQ